MYVGYTHKPKYNSKQSEFLYQAHLVLYQGVSHGNATKGDCQTKLQRTIQEAGESHNTNDILKSTREYLLNKIICYHSTLIITLLYFYKTLLSWVSIGHGGHPEIMTL